MNALSGILTHTLSLQAMKACTSDRSASGNLLFLMGFRSYVVIFMEVYVVKTFAILWWSFDVITDFML
jgi:hypothetical protein